MQSINNSKIVFVIPTLGRGGAETQLVEEINRFNADKLLDVFLIILSDHTPLLPSLLLPPAKISCIGLSSQKTVTNKSVLTAVTQTFKILRLLRKHNINIAVAHLPLAHFQMRLVTLISCLTKNSIKLVTYHHSMPSAKTSIQAKPFFKIGRLLANITDVGSIYVSRAVLQSHQNTESTYHKVIYNFAFDTRNRIDEKSKHGKYWVVVPGRIEPVKGQTMMIRALATYLSASTVPELDFEIIFAGGGSDESEIKIMADKSWLKNRIYVTGHLEHGQLLNYIDAADLIVIPSLSEGLCNVAIESIMLGKTVLCARTGGLPEVIIDGVTGTTFACGDGRDLANQLVKVMSNPGLPSQNLKKYYRETFTPERYLATFINYIELIKRIEK